MEKRVVLAVLLSLAILTIWSWFQPPVVPPAPRAPDVSTGTVEPVAGAPDGNGVQAPPGNGNGNPPAPLPAEEEDLPRKTEVHETERLTLTVDSLGGSLAEATVWACDHHAPRSGTFKGDPAPLTAQVAGVPGFLATRMLRRKSDLALRNWRDALRNWRVESVDAGPRVIVQYPTLGIEIEKRLVLSRPPAAPYHADLRVIVRGLPGVREGEAHTLEIVGPLMPGTSDRLNNEDGVVVAVGDEVTYYSPAEILEDLAKDPDHELTTPGLKWIGMREDFHLALIEMADGAPFPEDTSVGFVGGLLRVAGAEEPFKTAAATARLPLSLPGPGKTVEHDFRVYLGPNSRPTLTSAPYERLEPAFPRRGFWIISFGWISDLLGLILRFLADLGLGYGVAVAALTIVVRGCMFPLSRKSQISMRVHAKKMAKIKPKLDAIKAKHKDPRKQQQAQMQMMRDEKMSLIPGGCLLAFLQMPIWFALYGLLGTTFEMRHATFLWADSLTAPDHLLHMPWMPDLPLLPQWLNLFPILMMITWGISAHMTPLPADENQAKQAKMMRWMPMMFGVMLYDFASGLTIYMTCSALWSIGEIQLIRRVWLNKLDAA